eukprot:755833-Hanusia_phi.AAC.3
MADVWSRMLDLLRMAFALALIVIPGIFINVLEVLTLLVRPFSLRRYRELNRDLVSLHWPLLVWLIEGWAGVRLKLYGDKLPANETMIGILNHRSDVDWMIGFALCGRKCILGALKASHDSRVRAHGVLRRVHLREAKLAGHRSLSPRAGWGVERCRRRTRRRSSEACSLCKPSRSPSGSSSSPKELVTVSKDALRPSLHLSLSPSPPLHRGLKWLQCRKRKEANQSWARENGKTPLEHVLWPRAKAFVMATQTLKGTADAIYDATMIFEKEVGGKGEGGRQGRRGGALGVVPLSRSSCPLPREEVRAAREATSESSGRYDMAQVADKTDGVRAFCLCERLFTERQELEAWLDERWLEKERLFEVFSKHSSFLLPELENERPMKSHYFSHGSPSPCAPSLSSFGRFLPSHGSAVSRTSHVSLATGRPQARVLRHRRPNLRRNSHAHQRPETNLGLQEEISMNPTASPRHHAASQEAPAAIRDPAASSPPPPALSASLQCCQAESPQGVSASAILVDGSPSELRHGACPAANHGADRPARARACRSLRLDTSSRG